MWRGTTPTYNFTLPEGIGLEDFSTVYLTFAQNGHNVLEKTKDVGSGFCFLRRIRSAFLPGL